MPQDFSNPSAVNCFLNTIIPALPLTFLIRAYLFGVPILYLHAGESLYRHIENLFKFLNAIANKKRLMIINILKEKDRCVCELEAILDESQPSISHHLKILENAGLVRGWKKGKFTHYDLVKEQIISYHNLLNENLV